MSRERGTHNRQIDTLIGLCKGILADGEVKQSEVEFLHGWIIANTAEVADNPVFHGLFATVEKVLADGVLDPDETLEIRGLLEGITGSPVELGEILKSAHFPVDDPAPPVRFAGHTFLFTGTFAYGDRKQCERAGIARRRRLIRHPETRKATERERERIERDERNRAIIATVEVGATLKEAGRRVEISPQSVKRIVDRKAPHQNLGAKARGFGRRTLRAWIARERAPRILDAAIAGDGFTMAPGEVAGLVSGIEKERLGKGCMRPVIEDSPC